jgi:hypothetical protein
MVDITVSDFMKGRYHLMIYISIDIAKLYHFAAAISSMHMTYLAHVLECASHGHFKRILQEN